MTAGVMTAVRCFLREARWLGWQTLLVGSGLWLGAAVSAERFVVDLAETLEQQSPRSEAGVASHWGRRVLSVVWGAFLAAARWCQPGARAWRRLAVRIDAVLLERRGLTFGQGSQAA